MQILLANAKIMNDCSEVQPLTTPMFQTVANDLAAEMALCHIDTLAKNLDCSRSLAAENWRRYQNFHMAEKLPAIMAYNGQAYKHLRAKTLNKSYGALYLDQSDHKFRRTEGIQL